MAITMVEIARRTNLSPATISRVLNGKGLGFISAATRQRVLDTAQDMGYQTSRAARSCVPGRTQVISAWVRHPHRPQYARIIRHLLEAAASTGYELIIMPVHDHVENPRPVAASNDPLLVLTSRAGSVNGTSRDGRDSGPAWPPTDGMFLVDCPAATLANIRRIAPPNFPLVGLHCSYCEKAEYVGLDLADGARQAVEHLVSIGCRRIVHLSSLSAIERVRTSLTAAYEGAMTRAGMQPEIILSPDESRAAARSAIAAAIDTAGLFDGLFCLNDDMAIGAYRALRDRGLRIPQDVAIVGCDGVEDGQYLDVPLTTVAHPVPQMCREAWEIMLARIQNPASPHHHRLLKPELRVDGSSRR